MSLNEEKIREICREEMKKIWDTGFMNTEQTKSQPPKPQSPHAPVLNIDLDAKLDYWRENNVLWAKTKRYYPLDEWSELNEKMKALGGKYTKGKGWELP